MSTPKSSGQITLQNDTIVYTIPGGDGWHVRVADVRIIGEYTNDDGPIADDYFFVFISRDEWYEASFYADGRDLLLAELRARLHHEPHVGLCHSTGLASRILWPAHLEGHPLFDLVPEERGDTIVARFRQRVFPKVHMHFTSEVRKELE